MPTVVKRFLKDHPPESNTNLYSPPRMISLDVGCILIFLAVAGLFEPHFFGLELSLMHCFVLFGTGVMAVWTGLAGNVKRVYQVSLALGVFFLLNAVLGYVLGEPRSIGYGTSSDYVLKMAPGFMELSTRDHIIHLTLAIFFFFDAFLWKRRLKQQP
ncbi:MAG TPA: hypothetical protein VNJ08_04475 [Bacteriovoracaceae bacterium]|nr:hypothetical protein [Bacteriovoracaceae bacterium]